ncbi:hypothetical protein AB0H73_30850 [Streptomyces olivoreticuli]
MFEIRIICDPADTERITTALNATFSTGAVRRLPSRHSDRARLYLTADHKPGATVTQEWPDDQTAYEGAPPVMKEMASVLALSKQLRRPGGHTPAAEREQQLRKAALLDRIALKETAAFAPDVAANAVETAEAAAVTFALVDHATGHRTHGEGPRSPRWATAGYRGYVRQEYRAWLTGR